MRIVEATQRMNAGESVEAGIISATADGNGVRITIGIGDKHGNRLTMNIDRTDLARAVSAALTGINTPLYPPSLEDIGLGDLDISDIELPEFLPR